MPEPVEPATNQPTTGEPDPARPVRLTVVRGGATPQELAAVVAVLSAAAAAGDGGEEPAPRHTGWASPSRRVRTPLTPGPGAWRGSALPR